MPVLFLLLGIAALGVLNRRLRKQIREEHRQSPLARDMLRPPGYSLTEKLRDQSDEIYVDAAAVFSAPLLGFAIHLSQSYFAGAPAPWWRAFAIGIVVLFTMVYLSHRLIKRLKGQRNYALAFEGELATGQELDQLMLDGCRVFHDVPTNYGNIDHVVVSHSGVYTIETKTVRKPMTQDENKVIVDHSQNVIRFPHYDYPIPTRQLETQRDWLAKYLSSAIAEEVAVEPMLALPGWFIDKRIGRGIAYVFNPVKPHKFFLQNRNVLSPDAIQRIAHQLDQLCRSVPRSQREEKTW